MVARGGIRVAVPGGDVAGGTDREVDGAVGADGDALQRVCVGALQVGAAWRRAARRRRCAGWSPPRWRSRRRRPGRSRRHTAWTRRTPGRAAGPARRAAPIRAAPPQCGCNCTTRPVLGTDTSSAPSGVHAASLAFGDPRPHRQRPALGHQRLPRFVERGLRQIVGTSTVTGASPPRGCLGRGAGDAGDVAPAAGAGLVEHPASRRTRRGRPRSLTRRPNPHASPRPGSPTARWR